MSKNIGHRRAAFLQPGSSISSVVKCLCSAFGRILGAFWAPQPVSKTLSTSLTKLLGHTNIPVLTRQSWTQLKSCLGAGEEACEGRLRDSGDEGISIPSSLNNYRTVKPQRERLMISDRTFCTVGYSKSEAGCGADKIDAGPVEFVQSWSNSLRNFGPALGSPEMAAMAARR